MWAPPQENTASMPRPHREQRAPAWAEMGEEGDKAVVTPAERTPARALSPHRTRVTSGAPDFYRRSGR